MPEQTTTKKRYQVEKATSWGWQIIDTTGQDKPYVIQHDKKTAEHWAEKWNLVEAGHCGSCKKK